MKTQKIGNLGEEAAAKFLGAKGYTILDRGYRSRYGEIDLIVANHEFVVFVEVKTRKNDYFAQALDAVDRRKMQKIRQTAQLWLIQNQTEHQPRFDVIEVYTPQGSETQKPEIYHLEDAFS